MASIVSGLEGLFGEVPKGMTPAVTGSVDPVDELNSPSGQPAQERYPGAIPMAPHDTGQPPVVNDLPSGTEYAPEPFEAGLPHIAQGGGYQDTAWTSGHDGTSGPSAHSNQIPFGGTGAVNPGQYADDTGGVYVREHVLPAEIGTLVRRTSVGQTYNEIANTTETIGQNAPNNRHNLDQQQWWDPDGHNPWEIPYAERPIYNNLAHENVPVQPTGSILTPAGALPDRSPYAAGQAQAYEAPPSPDVASSAVPASPAPTTGNGWLLG